MKKVAAVVVVAGLLVSGMALAADKPTIGVVDLRKVMTESKIGKRNEAEFEKLVNDKKAQLQKEEQKLQAMQQDFQKNQMVLTDAQKQEKQKEFQGKVDAYRKLQAEAQQTVTQKQGELTGKSLGDIKAIVAALAKEQNLSVVLDVPEQGVLYAQGGVDLTQQVIQRYDAKAK